MKSNKTIALIAAAVIFLAGVGTFYWWPKDPPSPIVQNDKDKDKKTDKDPEKKDQGKPSPKVQPVAYEPAPVSLAAATEFLHAGPNPVQVGMDPKVLDARRAAALRGMVFKDEKEPFPSVNVSIQHQPAYGTGYSRKDGSYDMVVNGGGLMSVGYKHDGYLPVWRQASVPWQDYVWLSPVVMSKVDTQVTKIAADGSKLQTARATKVKDKDGERQTTLIFQKGTKAILVMPDGKTKPIDTLSIRATEYTVGSKGSERMPAPLPANSAYTYCVELSADEAIEANAKSVRFDKPVFHYVENFLDFPVGIKVPAGYFDPEKGAWVASESGRVIKILQIQNNLAEIDVDGKGKPADAKDLAKLKISDEERGELSKLYAAGTSLWRVAIPHFSIWDLNWGFSPPADAVPPKMPPPLHNPPNNKPAREVVEIPGIPWKLNHDNGRVPGAPSSRTIEIPASGKALPKSVKQIVIEIYIAGCKHDVVLDGKPDQTYTFIWDGKDCFGRPCQCSPTVRVRIGYVYDGVYEQTAVFGTSGNGEIITGSRTRREVVLWQEHQLILAYFDPRAFGFGGWSFDVHHAYDPVSRMLYLGNGDRSTVGGAGAEIGNLVIRTVAGGGKKNAIGEGKPAVEARLDDPKDTGGAGTYFGSRYGFWPRGLAVGPDGTVYLTDANHRIRRIGADGVIHTIAGGGAKETLQGKATELLLKSPRAIALAPDGSLYIAETDAHRVRRLMPDGTLVPVAGQADKGDSGDGGPALKAKLHEPTGLAVAPDGTLFIADQGNHRIRCVSPDGVMTTIAGGAGKQGYKGDGGSALKAELSWPTSLALGADGSLHFSDQGNYVVRRISSSGIISTVAGLYRSKWSHEFGGDDGPALKAKLDDPTGIAVAADGTVYIADTGNHRIRAVGPDGVIRTFAGAKPTNDHGDFSGDGGPARAALLSNPTALAFGPDGSLYFYDASYQRADQSGRHVRQRIRRISPPMPGFTNTEIAVPSPDGKELLKFDAVGRHLETLDVKGKELHVRFDYDKAGRLVKIDDRRAKTEATFDRDEKGRLRSILAPNKDKTDAQLEARGYLATLATSAGELARMTYSEAGLLEKRSGSSPREVKSDQPKTQAPKKDVGEWKTQSSGVKETLYSVAFVNDDVGVAVGANRTILRTTDGGANWKRLMGPVEEDDYLASVTFASDKLGYIHGSYTGNLYRTRDAGATWEPFVNPNPTGLSSIKGFAAHAAHGDTYYWINYAGAFSSLDLYKTSDIKKWAHLWEHTNGGLGGSGVSMVFTDADDGWMASTTHPGATFWVGRSSDGGKTWKAKEIKDKVRGGYMMVQAVNKNVGWFCSGVGNHVHATTDGGKTWTPHDLGNGDADTIPRLQFLDASTGYVLCGADHHVRQSTDGGKSWRALGKLKAPAAVNGMFFTPSGTGFVVGEKGYIARYDPRPTPPASKASAQAEVGGWKPQDSGVTDTLSSVAFVNDDIGIAVGANRTILRTTDGGATWKRLMGPVKEVEYLANVNFAGAKLGYIHGNQTGNLYRTKDAGATWEAFENPNPSGLNSIKGFSAQFARGDAYYWINFAGPFSSLALYKTSDAAKWAKLWVHENQKLGGSGVSMVFTDADDGWMASTTHPGAKFWVGRTSDGGKSWQAQEIKDKVRGGYMLMQAVNKDAGWFCSAYGNHVHATTDGGKSWTPHELGNGSADKIMRLQFLDAKTGYVLCGADHHVRQSTDGGKSWQSLGKLKAPGGVNGMFFTPSGTGFVVGQKGYIARYRPK
jgi:YD repeat-containing protein